MPISIDREELAERQARLDAARRELKAFFIGIDGVIDELCDAVAVWYTMPAVLSRPVIVNLWGMTGVGKTDLVRRLVKHLDIQERFVEIELSNNDQTLWQTSVAGALRESKALEGEPTLLLFDEIQRFNTIDDEGKPLPQTKFSDFWELLSDGRLAKREPAELDFLYASIYSQSQNVKRRRARGEEVNDEELGIWEAQQLRKTFGLNADLTELSQLSYDRALEHMAAAQSSKKMFEPADCSKCLVIISGNLDEAFTMAHESAEADVEADIFHAFTEKITMVDIKRALLRRFKPEQVARFGNIHLIYSSLRRADFERLIEREVERVCRTANESFGISVTVTPAVRDLVYRNGVFPVQGVRPVFSSVADILEANLAKFLFRAIVDEATSISIDYDHDAATLIGVVGAQEIRLPYRGRVDKIRDDTLVDKVANVAVHEAGHAIAYGVLFGLAPLQLTARVASSYVAGFTFPHQIYQTSQSILAQTKVYLAGGVAEEVIFGHELASVGRAADRERATELIIDFVRRHGFDREFQANYMLDFAYAMDRVITESDIEKLMTRLVAETERLLSEHRELLGQLGSELARRGSIAAAEVAELLNSGGVAVDVQPEGHTWMPRYQQSLEG